MYNTKFNFIFVLIKLKERLQSVDYLEICKIPPHYSCRHNANARIRIKDAGLFCSKNKALQSLQVAMKQFASFLFYVLMFNIKKETKMSTSEIAKQDYSMISKEIEEASFQDEKVRDYMKSSSGLLARIWPSEKDKIIQEFQNKQLDGFLSQYYKRLQMAFDLQLKTLKKQCDSYLVRVNTELNRRDAAFCQEQMFEAETARISNIKAEFLQKKSMELLNKRIESNYDAIDYLLQKFIDGMKDRVNIPQVSFRE